MAEVPFYLSNDVAGNQGDLLFSIPIYSSPQPQGVIYTPTQLEAMWSSLAESGSGLVSSVTETVTGTASGIFEGAKNAIGGYVGSLFDEIRTNILYFVLLLLLIVWVIAKSGILKQAAPLAKAFI